MGFTGSVTVNSADFYGVDVNAVEEYIKQIKAIAIEEAIAQLNNTDTLKAALDDGWRGQAKENFLTNFETARNDVVKSLYDGYNALVSEINQIGQGWLDQDNDMVKLQGGGR